MKVRELIEILEEYDDDLKVLVLDREPYEECSMAYFPPEVAYYKSEDALIISG